MCRVQGRTGTRVRSTCMAQVILDVQECSRICSFTSRIVNGWLVKASTGFVEVNSSLCCSIYRSSPIHVFLYFMEIFWMGTMWKQKVSLLNVWLTHWRRQRKPWKLKWWKQHDAFDQEVVQNALLTEIV